MENSGKIYAGICGKWKNFFKSVKKMTIFGKSLKTEKILDKF